MSDIDARADAMNGSLHAKFVAEGLGEFLEKEIKPREYLLAPWLPEQGLCMIHAFRGIGKTHVALGIGYAVASGGTFLRWTAKRPRNVLYIDGEMPAIAMQERLASIVSTTDCQPAPGAFRLMTPDSQPHGRSPNFANPVDQAGIEPLLDGVDLIVIDNISSLVGVRYGENDDQSWSGIQSWLLSQRAQGRSVLLVHHEGNGGLQRGTTKREDVLDTVIRLKHSADYDPIQGARFEVSFVKSRGFYGDDAKSFMAALDPVTGVWSCMDIEDATFDRVVELLRDTPDLRQSDIARELEINRSTVSRHAKRAKLEGYLKVTS